MAFTVGDTVILTGGDKTCNADNSTIKPGRPGVVLDVNGDGTYRVRFFLCESPLNVSEDELSPHPSVESAEGRTVRGTARSAGPTRRKKKTD